MKKKDNKQNKPERAEIEEVGEIIQTLHALFFPDIIEDSQISIIFKKRSNFQSALFSISIVTKDLKNEAFTLSGFYFDYSFIVEKRFKTVRDFSTIYETPKVPQGKEAYRTEGIPVEIWGFMAKNSWTFKIKIYSL